MADLCRIVDQLPEAQRLVVLLTSGEGFTYSETAAILSLPIDTVISRLVRSRVAIGRLRQKSVSVAVEKAPVADRKMMSV